MNVAWWWIARWLTKEAEEDADMWWLSKKNTLSNEALWKIQMAFSWLEQLACSVTHLGLNDMNCQN